MLLTKADTALTHANLLNAFPGKSSSVPESAFESDCTYFAYRRNEQNKSG
ncbi:hypothetical protein KR51_00036420 [Rubidibacter lacunae KORDI 51-2]|uniref:Uncharacterized protein n=1 Tax=Rubidibacter lacunae KORDI 51-2 TaxID=582515 RepID=U5DJJ5_9CHRO|nr:hypothetical protein KR51_00036420 [Rubidibacter lacunae KORDI 51-2]